MWGSAALPYCEPTVARDARSMTGSAKQLRGITKEWIASLRSQ
jgi:hypothetical protein